ncbi:oxidoreductase [Sphingobium aquiterrae]|uniref:oxidoreductase n=1 Tax=Sphingobium aquiterrae TaxID=2038656 RepID=UPI0030195D84
MIRVGIIGYGFVTKTFHLPLIGATDGIAVTAISSSRPDCVKADHPGTKVFENHDALVSSEEVDVVIVASPNDSHGHWARAALKAGKHVVVEKPFALSLTEARELIAASEAAGRMITVFQNRRWDSDFLSVKGAIDSGALGRVVHFESHFDRFQIAGQDRWWEKKGPGSGIWYDLAPHLVDQALQLFGCPDAVEANLCVMRDGSDVDDWAHAILHYPRCRVILHASVLVSGGSPRFIVHGDGGSLVKQRLDDQENQLLAGVVPGSEAWGVDQDELRLWDAHGQERRMAAQHGDQRGFYRALVQSIADGAPAPVRPHEALTVMAVIEAGMQSAAENRAVPLALSDAERRAWGDRS